MLLDLTLHKHFHIQSLYCHPSSGFYNHNHIMLAMAKSQKPYFKLNKENSKDHRDHYFMFNVEPSRDNNLVRLYCYDSTKTHISKNRPK